MAKIEEEEPEPGHPLFPPDEKDDDPPFISQIQITRMENGQAVYAPRMRQSNELQSLDQLAGEFGGGTYVLIGRHGGRILCKRKYVIPGKPKPMFEELGGEIKQEIAPAPIVNPLGEQGGIMGLIMMMMQQMMQQQSQAQQAQTQMFIAMMQNSASSTQADKEAQRAELAANIERERISSERTMSLMREMMVNRPAGGGAEEFQRGIEFMRSFATSQIQQIRDAAGANGESELEKLAGTAMELFQGYMQFKQQSNGVPQVPTGPVVTQ